MPDESHLVLVGLPGAGKTTVGRLLAARLRRSFVDADEEIERMTGISVARLFETRGEEAFRALEHKVTENLVSAVPAVFAPGGGWITRPETESLLRPPARLIWLMVSPQEALRRMGPGALERPLLVPSPLDRLEELLRQRAPFYGRADARVDTELISPQLLAEKLVHLASGWGGGVG